MTQRPRHFVTAWIALCLSFGLTACASSMANTSPEDPRGIIDLNARMPVGQSPYGSPYGVSTAARVRPGTPNIDEFLTAEPDKRVAAKPPMIVARAVPLTKTPVADFAPPPFEPVVNLEPNQEQLLAMANEQPPPTSSDDLGGDTSRYAEREAQSQKLEQFRGGDAIVITTGTLIVVLLIVILILLLT